MDKSVFQNSDWKDFYGEVVKGDPPNMSASLWTNQLFFDADHMGNKLTCGSHTGMLILLNNAPVVVLSKQKTACELST